MIIRSYYCGHLISKGEKGTDKIEVREEYCFCPDCEKVELANYQLQPQRPEEQP